MGACSRVCRRCFRPIGVSRMFYHKLLPLCIVVLFLVLAVKAQGPDSPRSCAVPSLEELLLPVQDQCPKVTGTAAPRVWSSFSSRVVELNEATLEQALSIVRSSNDTFMAVLFYASWCPFSKQLRPVFETLSVVFPTVFHVEVEESFIRPGLLSKYGVYSFPVLYMQSGASRFRYSGPRSLEDLTKFYYNLTGIQPWKSKQVSDAVIKARVDVAEPAISERLHNDTYLVLASWFLLLRLLLYVLPIAVTRIRNFWDRCHLYKMLKPRGPRQQNEIQGRGVTDRRSSKRRLSVPGWSHQIASPSSSLAIAESSARRVSPSEDLGSIIR